MFFICATRSLCTRQALAPNRFISSRFTDLCYVMSCHVKSCYCEETHETRALTDTRYTNSRIRDSHNTDSTQPGVNLHRSGRRHRHVQVQRATACCHSAPCVLVLQLSSNMGDGLGPLLGLVGIFPRGRSHLVSRHIHRRHAFALGGTLEVLLKDSGALQRYQTFRRRPSVTAATQTQTYAG